MSAQDDKDGGARKATNLTATQKTFLATLINEWQRVTPHVKAGTLLSLRDKGLIEGRGNPSYGMACMEMQYNSAAWQWRLSARRQSPLASQHGRGLPQVAPRGQTQEGMDT